MNEIVVKSYSDLKPYFDNKALSNQLLINNTFISEIEKTYELFNSSTNTLQDIAIKASNITSYVSEAKNKNENLTAILTPKMKNALKNGTAKICNSYKDGKIFPKIQYKDGSSEFISLETLQSSPNYTNMTVLANQMQMQQTLTSIQNTLLDFAEETDRQLSCLQRDSHQNRMIKAETAKLNFNSYLIGNLSKDILISTINGALPALQSELENNLHDLADICNQIEHKKTSIGMRKMIDKEQLLINYFLEGLTQLQAMCNIEMYLEYERSSSFSENEEHIFNIQNRYSEILIECLSEDILALLSGLSIFDEDIWEDRFKPGIQQLKDNKKEVLLCQKNVQENIMVKQ